MYALRFVVRRSSFLLRVKPELKPGNGLLHPNTSSFNGGSRGCDLLHICNREAKQFHTSSKSAAAPIIGPLLIKLTSGLSRLLAIFAGRYVRRWWRNLSPKDRGRFLGLIYHHRVRIAFGCSMGTCSMAGYYFWNLEDVPFTARRRFRVISREQVIEIAEDQGKAFLNLYEEHVLPSTNMHHIRVFRVVHSLLRANKDITKNIKWEVNVLELPDVNAFVLPTGQIFVMTGMLALMQSDDELAGVIGHEIAHALLDHTAEQLSFSGFFSVFGLAIIASLWAVIPTDPLAVLMHWIQNQVQDILIHMPYSRKLEREADYVGLLLAARSCYDVRRIVTFWSRMGQAESGVEHVPEQIEWLSTHPAHSKRAEWISEHMEEALNIRDNNNCPRLRDLRLI